MATPATQVERGLTKKNSAMATQWASRASTVVGSRDPSTALRMTMPAALSLHAVEGFLKNFEIAGVAYLVPCILNPLLLQ